MRALGIEVRRADYTDPESLKEAFKGAEKVLLISSSEVGSRAKHHRAVIDAVKTTNVQLLVYTSVLGAPTSPLELAVEHRETERALTESGVPHVLLRNGWYFGNYGQAIAGALLSGTLYGSAGDGKVSAATRKDYADAAVAALTRDGQAGKVYELAGDVGFTMTELAAELATQAATPVAYQDMPPADYKSALLANQLPEFVADMLTGFDVSIKAGALFDSRRQLSDLIGRPTTSLPEFVALTLESLAATHAASTAAEVSR